MDFMTNVFCVFFRSTWGPVGILQLTLIMCILQCVLFCSMYILCKCNKCTVHSNRVQSYDIHVSGVTSSSNQNYEIELK